MTSSINYPPPPVQTPLLKSNQQTMAHPWYDWCKQVSERAVSLSDVGSVLSVGLSLPGIFGVTGSPVTTSGTLSASFVPQGANLVLAGPVSGASAPPAFRALVAADIPGFAPVTSMVRLNTANGFGTTNTMYRRFLNVVTSQGADISYVDSPSLGGSFTINTAGMYAISYGDTFSVSAAWGISLNSAHPTTPLISCPIAEVLAFGASAANSQFPVCWTGYLPSGSVIHAHGDSSGTGTATNAQQFTIARVN